MSIVFRTWCWRRTNDHTAQETTVLNTSDVLTTCVNQRELDEAIAQPDHHLEEGRSPVAPLLLGKICEPKPTHHRFCLYIKPPQSQVSSEGIRHWRNQRSLDILSVTQWQNQLSSAQISVERARQWRNRSSTTKIPMKRRLSS